MNGVMKPAWALVAVVGLSAGLALTRSQQSVTVVEAEPPRSAALGNARPASQREVTPPALPPAAPEPASASEPLSALSGEVLESLPVANYTYLRLKTAQGEVWAAVPSADVRVHEQVQLTGVSLMRDFASKTLKRTFPSIYFGNLAGAAAPAGVNGGTLPPGHPPVTSL